MPGQLAHEFLSLEETTDAIPDGFAAPKTSPLASATTEDSDVSGALPHPDQIVMANDPGPALEKLQPATVDARDPSQPFATTSILVGSDNAVHDPRTPFSILSSIDLTSHDAGAPTAPPLASFAPPTGDAVPVAPPKRSRLSAIFGPAPGAVRQVSLGEVMRVNGWLIEILMVVGFIFPDLAPFILSFCLFLTYAKSSSYHDRVLVFSSAILILIAVTLIATGLEVTSVWGAITGWSRWLCVISAFACPYLVKRDLEKTPSKRAAQLPMQPASVADHVMDPRRRTPGDVLPGQRPASQMPAGQVASGQVAHGAVPPQQTPQGQYPTPGARGPYYPGNGYPAPGAVPPGAGQPPYPVNPNGPAQQFPSGYPVRNRPQGFPTGGQNWYPQQPISGYPNGYPQSYPAGYPNGYPQGYPAGYPMPPTQGNPAYGAPHQAYPAYGAPAQGNFPQGNPPQGAPLHGNPVQGNPPQGGFTPQAGYNPQAPNSPYGGYPPPPQNQGYPGQGVPYQGHHPGQPNTQQQQGPQPGPPQNQQWPPQQGDSQ